MTREQKISRRHARSRFGFVLLAVIFTSAAVIFAATGVRLRSLPMVPGGFKAS